MSELINHSVNEWMDESVNEWINQSISEWMNQSVNEWMDESVNEWMDESVNEWMNEWAHRANRNKTLSHFSSSALNVNVQIQLLLQMRAWKPPPPSSSSSSSSLHWFRINSRILQQISTAPLLINTFSRNTEHTAVIITKTKTTKNFCHLR